MSETLKILHIMSSHGGGISAFIQNKAEEMPAHHVLFDVATYSECPPDFHQAVEGTGGTIHRLINPKTEGWSAFKESFKHILNFRKYDIIHCHIAGYRSEAYKRLADRHSQADFYIHSHTAVPKKNALQNKIEQWFTRKNSKGVVGCGRKAILVTYGSRVKDREMMVIPNSIEVDQFIKTEEEAKEKRTAWRRKFGIEEDEILIGHIGRLHPIKNHQFTLALGQYIQEAGIKAKIIITGAGELEEELKSRVKDLNLEGTVQFSGRISPISDYYPALDALILPSFNEGLPTVVVEAQAAALPCLVSDTVTSEVDLGFGLVAYRSIEEDPKFWIDTIMELQAVKTPDSRERREKIIEKKFSNEASAQLYVDYFRGRIDSYQI